MQTVDVIIVGAGLSGLYAANLLQHQGISYQLYEASERIGGRLLSAPVNDDGLLTDLGATWFWPHQRKIQTLLNTLGIKHFEQYIAGDALYQPDANKPPERFAGAPGLSYRIHGSTTAITSRLADNLYTGNLHLAHPVTAFEKKENGWQVSVEHKGKSLQKTAQSLILAAPPRILLAKTNLKDFLSPSLHNNLSAQQTWMSAQAKFVATYPTAFWREAGLAGDAFSRVGPMAEIHDASATEGDGYALFGFIGVPAQQRKQLPNEELSRYCVNQLTQLFGEQALKPANTYLTDWAENQWICSEQDKTESPQHPEINMLPYSAELQALQLGFASTEVAQREAGYIEGALIAAEQAVADISTFRGDC